MDSGSHTTSQGHRPLGFGPLNRLPISRIARLDGVPIQWLDVMQSRSAQPDRLRLPEQQHQIVRARKWHIAKDEPAFHILLRTLLGVKADRVEGTVLITKGQGVFRVPEVV